MKKIKILVRKGKTKDGREFNAYKLIEENGRLVDLHFRKEVDTSKFDGLIKFECEAGYVQKSENYEFPRVYVSDIDYSTIKDLFSK